MSKSHVSLGQKQCMVCGVVYDSGAILMNTRLVKGKLRQSLERNTITGYGLCEEHQRLFDEEYIALVECSNTDVRGTLKQKNANRTGNICHLRRTVANDLFDIELPNKLPMVFIEIGVIEKLQKLQEESQ